VFRAIASKLNVRVELWDGDGEHDENDLSGMWTMSLAVLYLSWFN